MGRGRFVNQKLGKRSSRRLSLLKSQMNAARNTSAIPRGADARLPKKGVSRQAKKGV
jgi:hypothetical protein